MAIGSLGVVAVDCHEEQGREQAQEGSPNLWREGGIKEVVIGIGSICNDQKDEQISTPPDHLQLLLDLQPNKEKD
jgi:hypothetical protein